MSGKRSAKSRGKPTAAQTQMTHAEARLAVGRARYYRRTRNEASPEIPQLPPISEEERSALLEGLLTKKLVEVPPPEVEARRQLEAWANIDQIGGKFSRDWPDMWAGCRELGIDSPGNQHLATIANCMRDYCGYLMYEEVLIRHLYRRHGMSAENAAILPLDKLAQVLSEDCRALNAEWHLNLDQIASLVSRSKRTLERYKRHKLSPLPSPDVEGGGGRPDEWKWSTIRPWLEKEFGRNLAWVNPQYFSLRG
jgi:hypothetical protein